MLISDPDQCLGCSHTSPAQRCVDAAAPRGLHPGVVSPAVEPVAATQGSESLACPHPGAVCRGDGGGEQLDCGDGNGGGIRLARPRDAGLRGGGLNRLLPAGARSRRSLSLQHIHEQPISQQPWIEQASSDCCCWRRC